MFDVIAALGGGLFVVACIFVGARISWRGAQRAELPALAMGAGLLLSGGIGYLVVVVAQMTPYLSNVARSSLVLAHVLCNIIGLGALAYFTWRVFRPEASWARLLVWTVLAAEIAAGCMQARDPGLLEFTQTATGPWKINSSVALIVLAWAAGESLLHWSNLVKRRALGLADAVVTNRVFLWGLAMGSAATISLANLLLEAMGIRATGSAAGAMVIGPLGLMAASSVWLAFMPPRVYLRWLGEREGPGHGVVG